VSKIHILNGAQPYEFAPGRLNKTLADRAKAIFEAQGHDVRLTSVSKGYPLIHQRKQRHHGQHRPYSFERRICFPTAP
jgi:hypothetical protein